MSFPLAGQSTTLRQRHISFLGKMAELVYAMATEQKNVHFGNTSCLPSNNTSNQQTINVIIQLNVFFEPEMSFRLQNRFWIL